MLKARRHPAGLSSVLAGVVLASVLAMLGLPSIGGASASEASSWTEYHANPAGTGVSNSIHSVDTAKRFWTSPALDGQLYGEPLEYSGDVYVATQNDTVYALSSATGRVVWSRHLATAVPSSRLPCGNISPRVGITGTPVLDPSRDEIFVVADELVRGSPSHRLVGLSAATGAVELSQGVDPPGADPAALLQRTALVLDGPNVVFAMGGNYGDCASYRGRVVSVASTGSRPNYFTVDARPGQSQGAIWMGGAAPVIDARGDVWVSVGNGSAQSTGRAYDLSDSVLELSPALRLMQYFAPSSWPQDNARDLDMSSAPVLLASGQVLLTGKSRILYLLDGAHLGGIGGEQAQLASGCTEDIDGGSATRGSVVYLPCLAGTEAVRVSASPAALKIMWRASNASGPPIVAAGQVWTIGSDGTLYGLDPSTGVVRQRAVVGTSANHFSTPSVGDGLLVAAANSRVVAFRATQTN